MIFRQTMFLDKMGIAFRGIFSFKGLKATIASVVALLQFMGAFLFDLPTTPYGETLDLEKYKLIWSDEFDGDTLNEEYWTVSNKGVRRGGYWDDSQVSMNNGNLCIRTEYLENGKYGAGWYSAEVETLDKIDFKYGYLECRCICAPGVGLWSAFWTFSHGVGKIDGTGRDGAEIDIFESPHYNYNRLFRDSVTHSVHFDGYEQAHQRRFLGSYYAVNPYTEFNTYGVEWTENELVFYVNGVETARIADESVPQVSEWLKLSVEVNGTNGVPGLTDDGTIDGGDIGVITDNGGEGFKTDFLVDYVRVYTANPV